MHEYSCRRGFFEVFRTSIKFAWLSVLLTARQSVILNYYSRHFKYSRMPRHLNPHPSSFSLSVSLPLALPAGFMELVWFSHSTGRLESQVQTQHECLASSAAAEAEERERERKERGKILWNRGEEKRRRRRRCEMTKKSERGMEKVHLESE